MIADESLFGYGIGDCWIGSNWRVASAHRAALATRQWHPLMWHTHRLRNDRLLSAASDVREWHGD